MTIGLIADPCDPKKPGGLGRCIFELAKATIAAAPEHSFTVYSKSDFPVRGIERKPLPKRVFFAGGRALDPALDAYIFFTPVIPLFFRSKKAIVVAEDFAYLELARRTVSEKTHAFATYLMHRRSLRMAHKIVCISEATKQSVIEHFIVPPEKCSVVPLADMPLGAPQEAPNLPERFFFFAGALKERKNVANLVRAFALFFKTHPEYFFLIAGKTGGPYYESLVRLAQELGIEERVRFLGHVNDGHMAYLYSRAEALVFSSTVEGFGMPLIEAMRAGLPVITSNEGALAEVASDAALLANPESPEEIAQAMTRLAGDTALRDALIKKGRSRAGEFSWERSGRLIAALFQS